MSQSQGPIPEKIPLDDRRLFEIAVKFTEAYKANYNAHPAIREALCLSELFPAGLYPLQPDDSFAGTVGHAVGNQYPVIFSTQIASQIGYFANIGKIRKIAEEYPELKDTAEELVSFWKKESTFVKIREEAPPDIRGYYFPKVISMGLDADGYRRKSTTAPPLGAGFISGSYDTRVAGVVPDFGKLVTLGLDGLKQEVLKADNGKNDFYKAALIAIDTLARCCAEYAKQAHKLGKEKLEKALLTIEKNAPKTLFEAIQLILIYTTVVQTENHGRLDIVLGNFLCRDLEAGLYSEEEAIELICEFWRKIETHGGAFDSRIVIGGVGRPDEKSADKFALLAMEATRLRHNIKPVLTLRLHKNQNPALFEKALDLISEGCIYPTLYNDDVLVPAYEEIMHVGEDARDYFPLGCGEVLIAGKSIGSPNTTCRFLKALEAALHNGRDGVNGIRIGNETGEVESFDTFEKLENALFSQIENAIRLEARAQWHSKEIAKRETAFVHLSLLTDDCIKRGCGLHEGGVRYLGANQEGFGITNTANSMAAIKKLVYDEGVYTLRELVDILDKNFEGHEADRKRMLHAPKWGNSDEYVDTLKRKYEEFIHKTADKIGRAVGFHYYTSANVNPGGITIGPRIAASADGRRCGEYMAVGNSAAPGTDKSGLTAMLLSAANSDPKNGGAVTNVCISRQTICEKREIIKDAFLTYFALGGSQLNVNCFGKGDLEAALIEPEKYENLIVRVSGYSAKFTALDKITQQHIMERTLF